MDSINTFLYSSPPHFFATLSFKSLHNSFSVKRRRSRNPRQSNTTTTTTTKKKFNYNPTTKPPLLDTDNNSQNLKLVLDVDQISSLASSKFRQFISLSEDAYNDLRTLVTVDDYNRVVFSCRKSTVQFVGILLLCGFVSVSLFRFLISLGVGLKRRLGFGNQEQNVVVRRDRSLGGREVIVARADREGQDVNKKSYRGLDDPLSSPGHLIEWGLGSQDWRSYRARSEQKLPKWWPPSEGKHVSVVNQEEYQKEANRLIREITDYRTSGKDVMEDDIIQLRRICRTSGVQVSFETTNTRDAFYRASIDFVLNVCSSAPSYSTFIQIDGEDAQQFIAGLAENIRLENIRAARMVAAAVAARTRYCFLQAWALEARGKHSEAMLELSKICLVHQTFRPEESSPEMEMVARGLGKHLKLEQRELLMNMFVTACSKESHRSAADALGLLFSPKGVGDQQNIKHM